MDAKESLSDPLSDVTRKERKMLLAVSVLAVILVRTGLVPNKISTLGVEFDDANRSALLGVVAMVTGYFITAFVVYGISDFLTWRTALFNRFREVKQKHFERMASRGEGGRSEYGDYFLVSGFMRVIFGISNFWSFLRAVFEFVVPVVFGIYAIVILLRYVPAK